MTFYAYLFPDMYNIIQVNLQLCIWQILLSKKTWMHFIQSKHFIRLCFPSESDQQSWRCLRHTLLFELQERSSEHNTVKTINIHQNFNLPNSITEMLLKLNYSEVALNIIGRIPPVMFSALRLPVCLFVSLLCSALETKSSPYKGGKH